MDHSDALRLSAAERFLLEDLPPGLREEFEEHFFDCAECAMDLRAGAALLRQVKVELRHPPQPQSAQEPVVKPASRPVLVPTPARFLRPALAFAAIAAMALVIAYQNAVTLPHLRQQLEGNEVAAVSAPAILPVVSLVGGTSRGDKPAAVVTNANTPVLLALDVPTEDRFASYQLSLYTPDGALAFQLPVSQDQARNTLNVPIPVASLHSGIYTLLVQGMAGAGEAPVGVGRYHFSLEIRN